MNSHSALRSSDIIFINIPLHLNMTSWKSAFRRGEGESCWLAKYNNQNIQLAILKSLRFYSSETSEENNTPIELNKCVAFTLIKIYRGILLIIGLFKNALSSEDDRGLSKGNLIRSGLDCSGFGVAGVTFEVLWRLIRIMRIFSEISDLMPALHLPVDIITFFSCKRVLRTRWYRFDDSQSRNRVQRSLRCVNFDG